MESQFQSDGVFDPPEVDVILPIGEEDGEFASEGEEEIEARQRLEGPGLPNLLYPAHYGAPDTEIPHEEGGIEHNNQEDDELQMEEVFELLLMKSIAGFQLVFMELGKLTREGLVLGLMKRLLEQTEKAGLACKCFHRQSLS